MLILNLNTQDNSVLICIDFRSRGLDPKYFQSTSDKDFITNPQILKTTIDADNMKINSTSRAINGRKQISAYFPKKPVTS